MIYRVEIDLGCWFAVSGAVLVPAVWMVLALGLGVLQKG
jgi:hypothetical protein